jgi:hypothetical protein
MLDFLLMGLSPDPSMHPNACVFRSDPAQNIAGSAQFVPALFYFLKIAGFV